MIEVYFSVESNQNYIDFVSIENFKTKILTGNVYKWNREKYNKTISKFDSFSKLFNWEE